jgi:hypothetical protein
LSAASIVAIRPDTASGTIELVDPPQTRLTFTHLPAAYSAAVILKVVHNIRIPAKTNSATHPLAASVAVAVVVVQPRRPAFRLKVQPEVAKRREIVAIGNRG